MLSKATIKYIKSLQVKKYRKQEQCFAIEGAKSVEELLASDFEVLTLVGTAEFLGNLRIPTRGEVYEVSQKTLETLGEFQTNRSAIAVARIKSNTPLQVGAGEYGLVLDEIRDPGNLGTIVRTADWYGIRKIIASPGTADFYNPKVVTSTMGSFTRVNVYYTDLEEFLRSSGLPAYGAFLAGEDVHATNFAPGGLIVIGSESHGISESLQPLISTRVTIPRYGHAESLNAAIATAVICDNMSRVRLRQG